MPDTPKLTICVPSRNRQVYFRQTIADLIRNRRQDVEFIFADNSDDPTLMNDFMSEIDDPRVRFLPSADHCLPMEDNWERVLEAARGDWVAVIGDDDYLDPELASIIADVEARAPATEAIGWTRLTFKWPGFRDFPGNMHLSLSNRVLHYPRQILVDRMFRWEQASHMPFNPFTIYHGAVRRDFAGVLKMRYSGRYFEHPVVDYEFGCKIIHSARHLVYIERPMSVLGTCADSNSAAANNFERSLENYEALIRDTGGGEEGSEWMKGFPFRGHLGIAGAIMSVQHWFKQKYRFPVDGWEENYARALALDCRHSESRRAFDLQVELCRRALSDWKGGRLLKHFQPVYIERRNAPVYTGMKDGSIYIDDQIGDARTPGQLFDIIQQILSRREDVSYELGTGILRTVGVSTAA